MYNWPQLFNDHNISYNAEEAIGRGRIVIPCPFCKDTADNMKGSIHIESTTFYCFKCGGHPIADTIKLLTGEDWNAIRWTYKTKLDLRDYYLKSHKADLPKPSVLSLPAFTGPLQSMAKKYLFSRKFDPDYLEKKYKLQCTNHLGDYKFRIIIPIYYNKQLISYQGRDYTGKSSLRYMSCPTKDEVIHYKDIVYGIDDVPGEHVVIVEGIFDKWRIGNHAVCTFGTGYTDKQVLLLSQRFPRITVLFDSEPQAQAQAVKLGSELSGLGNEVDIILLEEGSKDPGDMEPEDVKDLLNKLLKR